MFEMKKKQIEEVVLKLISEFCNLDIETCKLRYKDIKGTYNDSLSDKWYASNCTDFAFYDTPEYLLDNLNSYFHISSRNCEIINKVRVNDMKSIIDFAGGIGLTSIYLKEHTNKNIKYFAWSRDSLEYRFAKFMCTRLKIDIKFITQLENADCVLFSEVFEHIQNPITAFNRVIDFVKPQYIIHHSSFSMPAYGHYTEFDSVFGVCTNKEISKLFNANIKSHGYRVLCKGWNAIPIVYVKVKEKK